MSANNYIIPNSSRKSRRIFINYPTNFASGIRLKESRTLPQVGRIESLGGVCVKKAYLIAAILAAAAGTGLHFLYNAVPNLFTALLSPINESVWEHLKLLYWPTLAAGAVLSLFTGKRVELWSGFFIALVAMPVFLVGAYYGLHALGVESLPIDLILYYLTMALGFYLAWKLRDNAFAVKVSPGVLMAVMLYGAALILFTFAAPEAPIFLPAWI